MTKYQFYVACYRAAEAALAAGGGVQAAVVAVRGIGAEGVSSGAAWRLEAQAIRDAVVDHGGFVAVAGSRQADALRGPVFNGYDVRDIRPADQELVRSARDWALQQGNLGAELVSVHADQCEYFLLAV